MDHVTLHVPHPRTGRPYVLQQAAHLIYFPGTHTWIGRAEPGSLDELVLTMTDGAVAGHLSLGLEQWRVRGSLDQLVAEPELDQDDHAADYVGVDLGTDTNLATPSEPSLPSKPGAPSTAPTVDVLAVYGDDAVWSGVGTRTDKDSRFNSDQALRAWIVTAVAVLDNAGTAHALERPRTATSPRGPARPST